MLSKLFSAAILTIASSTNLDDDYSGATQITARGVIDSNDAPASIPRPWSNDEDQAEDQDGDDEEDFEFGILAQTDS